MDGSRESRGPIAWMARNSVTANLAMIVLIAGGAIMLFRVKQEVFPEFNLDMIQVTVAYPGASPGEVEQGIIQAVEEEVRGLDGVKRVNSHAFEGLAVARVELLLIADANKLLQDVKNAVDRITSFPEDAERPTVSVASNRREVKSLVIYGDQPERVLRGIAEQAREDLLQRPGITLVELQGERPPEISIEVPRATLRKYGLTLEAIARKVENSALDLPGGGVKTRSGEVLLRTAERRDLAREFADIPILTSAEGTEVRLGDAAEIVDGFEDTDEAAYFNGRRAIMVRVYRVGDQKPLEVASQVKDYVEELRAKLPPGVKTATWQDWSDMYRDRVKLLLRNAALGLLLVLVILGLFLEGRLAFWVTMGIPVSFLGAILLMPAMGVSINMISLFAFIMALGMVVDDAIVVGENVHEMRERGDPLLQQEEVLAATRGAQQVVVPVTFAVLTNVAAFVPLFLVPGFAGKMFRTIPAIIVPVFLISLLECLYILPAHVAHEPGFWGRLLSKKGIVQRGFARLVQGFINRVYTPLLRVSLRWRYLSAAVGVAMLAATVAYVLAGHVDFSYMPRIESDLSTARAVLPYGAPIEQSRKVMDRLSRAAREVLGRHGGDEITLGIFGQIGQPLSGGAGPMGEEVTLSGSHMVSVQVYMVPADQRAITAAELTREWRREVGDIPGLETLEFQYNIVPTGGAPIDVELAHRDVAVLESAAEDLAEHLRTFVGVKDIDKGFARGKTQLDFKIKPEARSLGITAADLGRQVRSAFYGAEALRQQRGRDETKVMVRLPEDERRSEYDVEELLIRTPQGGEIPLREAAEVVRGRAYTEIKRTDGRRVMDVTADVEPGVTSAGKVLSELKASVLPDVVADHPGLTYSFAGEQRELRESLTNLSFGFGVAMVVIFAMLAVPLKSYLQPMIVMIAIPFGVVGAVVGHVIMGFELSLISMMGIVALAGVVVNDSLVLIHANNEFRLEGNTALEAMVQAGARRFRPILLTSLTTFAGLAPMIFETSVQARFLIPMAISLGYGVLFATLITLLLVPSLALIIDDLARAIGVNEERMIV